MKTITMSLTLIALLLLALPSFAANNGGEYDADAQIILGQPTIGLVKCTAAINADGTVANCFGCNRNAAETRRLGPGNYEVDFTGICSDVRATLGWSRWVQVDTLSIGSIFNATCTTADRAGDNSSIWVFCTNYNGIAVDVPFFLFVAR